MLGGKVRVAEWTDGEEPMLQVEKRGRFITNMGFANFVTAAVESDDPRIKGTCMVILEETDPGTFDRGTPTAKLVHQLSSTRDPIFNLNVPASRIIGGYTVKDGVIVPHYSHGEIIEAVFRRTRVTVGIMTSAKLLSAVEPVIRYQRAALPRRRRRQARLRPLRTRPAAARRRAAPPGRCLGHRRSRRSLGFEAARVFDGLDPLEKQKTAILQAARHPGRPREMKALRESEQRAIELLHSQRTIRAAQNSRPIRWCSSSCSIPSPTCSAPPASCGTPATART